MGGAGVRVGSLFTGYGGLDMAVQALFPGSELVWVAEIEPAACRLLEYHHPGVPNLGDVTKIDWEELSKGGDSGSHRIDILTGGYP